MLARSSNSPGIIKGELVSRNNQQGDMTFAEAPGLESNQHAKKLAQEKSRKKAKKFEIAYSQRGHKVVKVTFKPNGAYQEYVGSLNKKKNGEGEMLKKEIERWKKQGEWIHEHELDEFSSKKVAALSK